MSRMRASQASCSFRSVLSGGPGTGFASLYSVHQLLSRGRKGEFRMHGRQQAYVYPQCGRVRATHFAAVEIVSRNATMLMAIIPIVIIGHRRACMFS